MNHSNRIAGLLALAGILVSCDSDLADYELVENLRILGMAVDPPWPEAGTEARLDALVVLPHEADEASLRYAWRWCLVDGGVQDGHPCPEGWGGELGRELGQSWTLPDPAELQAACDGGIATCNDGRVTLFAVLEVESADDRRVGLAEVTVRLSGRGHRRPEIGSLTADAQTLSDAHPTPLPNGVEMSLALTPAADAREATEEGSEVFTVSWFVTHGELRRGRTRPDGDASALNTWTLEGSPEEAWLYAVLRDGRGGTGWARYRVEAER